MNPQSPATEAVVRHHLTAFLERRGVEAIVADYSEAAHFHTEAEVYVGKQEIHGFFEHFISSSTSSRRCLREASNDSSSGASESRETSPTSRGT